MGAIRKGRTRGRKLANIWNSEAYYKESLGRLVIRAKGVNRRSEAVLARNEKIRANPPASKCKGYSFADGSFQACLSKEMSG